MPFNLYIFYFFFLYAVGAVIDNAIKFTQRGEKVGVKIAYGIQKSLLVCTVRDTGIEINPENQNKIFEIAQIDSSASRKHEGAGLGLALASWIARQMNSSVKVESAISKGSIFILTFSLKTP